MTRSNSYVTRRQRAGFRPRLETLEDRTAPTVFTVTNTSDTGKESLRQAVLSANATPGPDLIRFDPAVFATPRTIRMTGGQITITDPVSIEGPAAGLTLDAGYLSGHFTLSMTNGLDPVSMSRLTLTHGGDYSASVANQNATLTLSKMVITNNMNEGISVGVAAKIPFFFLGWGGGDGIYDLFWGSIAKLSLADSTVSSNSAGGVHIVNGEADIIRSTISGNSNVSGAGVNVAGSLTLTDCIVSDNTSTDRGGGISVSYGQATVINTTITGNVSGLSGSGLGGGIWARAPLTIARSTISGNTADFGGGIYILADALTMDDSTVSRNKASMGGGGIYMRGGGTVIRNCTISGNFAGGTVASARGGGLAVINGALNLQNSTVAFNSASRMGSGGGIDNRFSTIILRNVIVSNNSAGKTAPDLNGEANADYSLIGNTSGAYITGGNNQLDIDARLGPLADNGGPTRTHALLPGSRAINGGSHSANITTDQRGPSFPRVFGAAADIGAFELQQSTVQSVVVNAGQADLVQRSIVTSVTVAFSGPVTFAGQPTAAFRLTRTGPGEPSGNVTLAVDLSGSTATQAIARLTFSGPLTEGPNSLVDGNYALTVLSGQVSGGILGGDNVSTLFRLYGDGNGDKAVNGLDLSAFRNALGRASTDAGYVSYLDFNGDGAINGLDLPAFRSRFGVTLP